MPAEIRLNPIVFISSVSLLLLSSSAHAAGFALTENSGSGIGSAFAGAAATAEDATTVWTNPAGMSQLGDKAKVSQVLHVIMPTSDFSNKRSRVNPVLTGGSTAAAQATLTGKDDDGGKTALVPNLYYVKPINSRLHFGVGINAPYGLEITYDDDWIGRYQATNSEMKTININPSLSWKANDKLTLGAGLNAQYIEVKLGSKVDSGAACRSAASTANSGALLAQCLGVFPRVGQSATDSNAEVSGDDVSFGYNLGAMIKATDKTRIGLSYRSSIKHNLEGDADFAVNDALSQIQTSATTNLKQVLQATRLKNRPITASVKLPESASFSVAHKVNSKLELLADATWTGWSSFQELRIVDGTGSTVSVTPEKWNDVWRYSIGGNYKYNDKLTLRAGAAFDETPVPSAKFRTPRLPGNDRTWLSVGANYKVNKHMDLDFGLSHLIVDETPIDNTDDKGYTVSGVYDADVNIISTQLNWTF